MLRSSEIGCVAPYVGCHVTSSTCFCTCFIVHDWVSAVCKHTYQYIYVYIYIYTHMLLIIIMDLASYLAMCASVEAIDVSLVLGAARYISTPLLVYVCHILNYMLAYCQE